MAESKEGDHIRFVWAGDRPTAKFMTTPNAFSSTTARVIATTLAQTLYFPEISSGVGYLFPCSSNQ